MHGSSDEFTLENGEILTRWTWATENQVGLAIRAIVKVNIGKSMIDDVIVVEQTRKYHNKIVLGVQKEKYDQIKSSKYV